MQQLIETIFLLSADVRYVLIRYGNFYQFVAPVQDGHISVCIEPHANPLNLAKPIQSVLHSYGVSIQEGMDKK